MFMERCIGLVDLKVLSDESTPTFASNLVMTVSTSVAQNCTLTAVGTDDALNNASILNELHRFPLPIIRIPWVAHTANRALGDF
jgi:hypothetical protein